MNHYSEKSMSHLKDCHLDLQIVFAEALQVMDHSILESYRGEKMQNHYFSEGKSKVRYPDSKHNNKPSGAIHAAPYPIDWNDRERMTYFAGVVLGIAHTKGIKIRWGGDWDQDTQVKDNSFDDLIHFERVKKQGE